MFGHFLRVLFPHSDTAHDLKPHSPATPGDPLGLAPAAPHGGGPAEARPGGGYADSRYAYTSFEFRFNRRWLPPLQRAGAFGFPAAVRVQPVLQRARARITIIMHALMHARYLFHSRACARPSHLVRCRPLLI